MKLTAGGVSVLLIVCAVLWRCTVGSGFAAGRDLPLAGYTLLAQPIVIEGNAVIGSEANPVTLDGTGVTRLIEVRRGSTLTLINVTLVNGAGTNGGAIYNEGRLRAFSCVFSNNLAAGLTGIRGSNGAAGSPDTETTEGSPGTAGENGGAGTMAAGGAIFNAGTLTARDCLFIENAAIGGTGGAGGRGGDADSYRSAGAGGNGGHGGVAAGGAIYSSGRANFSACQFLRNSVNGGSGGAGGPPGTNVYSMYFSPVGNPGSSGLAFGGAVFAEDTVTFASSTFEGNRAVGGAGINGAPGHDPYSNPQGTYYSDYGAPGADGSNGGEAAGGALFSTKQAVVNDCTWLANGAEGGAGGHGGTGGTGYSYSGFGRWLGGDGGHGADGGGASGGSIAAFGVMVINGGTFLENRAMSGAGGNGGHAGSAGGSDAYGHDAVVGLAGKGGNAAGGVLHVRGRLRISDTRISGNQSIGAPGGRAASPGVAPIGMFFSVGDSGLPGASGDAFGAGLFVDGTTTGADCEFIGNSAVGANGTDGYSANFPGTWKMDAPSGTAGANGGLAAGGAAYLAGNTSLQRIVCATNVVVGGNGGLGGRGNFSMYSGTVGGAGGLGGDTEGGAVFIAGVMAIREALVTGNRCIPGFGGNGGTGDGTLNNFAPPENTNYIDPTRPGGGAGAARGAGIAIGPWNARSTITSGFFSNNTSMVATGGLGGFDYWSKAADGSNTIVFATSLFAESPIRVSASTFLDEQPQIYHGTGDGVSNVLANFCISGWIMDGATGQSNVTVAVGPYTTSTDAHGRFSVLLEKPGRYTVKPSARDALFTPRRTQVQVGCPMAPLFFSVRSR